MMHIFISTLFQSTDVLWKITFQFNIPPFGSSLAIRVCLRCVQFALSSSHGQRHKDTAVFGWSVSMWPHQEASQLEYKSTILTLCLTLRKKKKKKLTKAEAHHTIHWCSHRVHANAWECNIWQTCSPIKSVCSLCGEPALARYARTVNHSRTLDSVSPLQCRHFSLQLNPK